MPGGRSKEVTARAEFSLADPAVARFGPVGRVMAAGDGETRLKVTFGSLKAQAAVVVVDSARPPPFSFEREIGAILTRRGCNDIACHAGVKGQGGFRLSINAAHPRQDYGWIVKGGVFQVLTDKPGEPIVPRVDLEVPARSLLLRKPALEVAHGGGLRLEKGSEDYQAILAWIGREAPYRDESRAALPGVEGLEVFPREGLLQEGESRQLIVTARLSDGTREDFTHRVRFESKQQEVAELAGQGLVRALNPGESNILVRGAGYEVQSRIGVVAEWIPDYPELSRTNFIDDEVFAKLRKFNILPSPRSGDAEFLRRVCLDLTGRIPPAGRVREFLADPDPQKREKLIEVLLGSPEFVDYWTFRLADLFRVAVFPVGINPKWSQSYWEWIRDAVARNRPYDRVAEERIAAQGYSPASRHYLPLPGPASSRKHDGRGSSGLHGAAPGLRPVPRPPLRALDPKSVLGHGGLFRVDVQARRQSGIGGLRQPRRPGSRRRRPQSHRAARPPPPHRPGGGAHPAERRPGVLRRARLSPGRAGQVDDGPPLFRRGLRQSLLELLLRPRHRGSGG